MGIFTTINDKQREIELRPHPETEGIFLAEMYEPAQFDEEGEQTAERSLLWEGELKLIEDKPGSITLAIGGQVGFYEFTRDKGRIVETIHSCRSYKTEVRTQQQRELEVLLDRFGAGAGGSATETKLLAAMPGKILGFNVKKGDRIELGQVVCVLEAMKMENEISSNVEGVVKDIPFKVGDNVANGDVLLEVEPPE